MQSPARLFYAADRRTVVAEDDPRAAFLLIGKGQSMPDSEARRLGIFRYLEQQAETRTTPDPEVEGKAVEASEAGIEDKAVSPSETENKSVTLPESRRPTPGARR